MSYANVQDGARLNIVMNGFWGKGPSMRLWMSEFLIHLLHLTVPVPYLLAIRSTDENVKRSASFTIIMVVMPATGGLAHEAIQVKAN